MATRAGSSCTTGSTIASSSRTTPSMTSSVVGRLSTSRSLRAGEHRLERLRSLDPHHVPELHRVHVEERGQQVVLAAGEGGTALEEPPHGPDHAEDQEVADHRWVELRLGESGELPVPMAEGLAPVLDQVGRRRLRHRLEVAEVLAWIADLGQLPVEQHDGAVLFDEHVRALEVAVDEAERHRLGPVGVEPGGDVPEAGLALAVVAGSPAAAVDARG